LRRLISLIAALGLLSISGMAVLAQPVEPQPECRYFEEIGHNLCAPFLGYWTMNGGLPVFGYPIAEAADEVNPDLGEELLTQYFERERMEHHPENAGTSYEVLLGRLGNEVLLEMGRDWFTFPTGDPSDEHYFAETGHAIGNEFSDYWSSHGLDLGDTGISFAESLALFGYPISEPAMETNLAGDTVLTQWFERARFELHPDNPDGQQVLLGLLGAELMELQAGPALDVIASGLDHPRGLMVDAHDVIYVAEAGTSGEDCPGVEFGSYESVCFGDTGAITMIANGEQSQIIGELPSLGAPTQAMGAHDVIVGADGEVYFLVGVGADPTLLDQFGEIGEGFGYLYTVDDGAANPIADFAAHEIAENPDGAGIGINPYRFVMLDDGSFIVADSGANAVLHVTTDGTISTIAPIPAVMVDAPPALGLPEGAQIPMESVPTGIAIGPDGAIYVGELNGFPFLPGAAKVWRVTMDGEIEVFAEGFTNISDIAFDANGNLLVVEFAANGVLSGTPDGRLVQVLADGTQTTLADASDGLLLPNGIAVGIDGTIYVTNQSLFPGEGQVVSLTLN